MKALAINSGSSSLKFKLYNLPSEEELFDGQYKHYSENEYSLEHSKVSDKRILTKNEWDNKVEGLITLLISSNLISSINELSFIAHRIVHGGEKYVQVTLLGDDVISDLEQNFNDFAPLHNPIQTSIIKEFRALYPEVKQVGVFDTSFNLTVPEKAFLYGLPYEYYEKFKVRRYGFHGISHKFILSEVQKLGNNKYNRIISCHLGSGSSICAIKNNEVVENSFGFSPLENLIMSTRVGEIDYDAILYLKSKLNISDSDLDIIFNKKSGLLGISKLSSDMQLLLSESSNNRLAKLAVEMYVYNIIKYIGSFVTVLGGIDVLIFSAGIGQGSDIIRKMICDLLFPFKIVINDGINNDRQNLVDNLNITSKESACDIFVIPTNEELQMIREGYDLIN